MRGLLLASAMSLSLVATACGTVSGATIGAVIGSAAGEEGAAIGGAIGGVLGALLDLHAHREQRRYEAQENELNARAQVLTARAESLEYDNAQLERRVVALESAVRNARGRGLQVHENRRELRRLLDAEQTRANQNIVQINAAQNTIRARIQQLDRRDPQYSSRLYALQRQQQALASARGLFVRITQVSV